MGNSQHCHGSLLCLGQLELLGFPDKLWSGDLLTISLTHLSIRNSFRLYSLDGMQLQCLTSLLGLEVYWCSQLQHLPSAGLPASLCYLDIWGCEKFIEQCEWNRGQVSLNISHLLGLRISGKDLL
ncbi:hypothetical protein Nepgr_022476 [Nepenthes gracilis]|uniref:Uncharacterized protein n=1 Tax=Nepenthes gracilis TaxID=150966 RepID=A0AAD3T0V5_NEPGR|nr:hypothetical protein Nepgr_022476 [Nepenthes gracilis]